MALRRSHRKSRHGCLNCKQRKVKCDEARPGCSNCAKRGLECHYESVGSFVWAHQGQKRSPSSHGIIDEGDIFKPIEEFEHSHTAAPSLTGDHLMDLELMMHWCNSTFRTFARNDETEHIWRSLVPQQALSHSFLMHGILALSALHLSRTKGEGFESPYMKAASAHKSQALVSFRKELDAINSSNAKAVFSFSSIVAVYAFGFLHNPDTEVDPCQPVNDLCQVLVLIRGIQQVVHSAAASLLDSDFRAVLKMEDSNCVLSEDTQIALAQLHEANSTLTSQYSEHDYLIYAKSIESLEQDLTEPYEGSQSVTGVGRWAIRLPKGYMERLQEGEQFALVVLTYYCVILHRLGHHWCFENWGKRVSGSLWGLLNEDSRILAQWAIEQIG